MGTAGAQSDLNYMIHHVMKGLMSAFESLNYMINHVMKRLMSAFQSLERRLIGAA